jgi:hypothetical protein
MEAQQAVGNGDWLRALKAFSNRKRSSRGARSLFFSTRRTPENLVEDFPTSFANKGITFGLARLQAIRQ